MCLPLSQPCTIRACTSHLNPTRLINLRSVSKKNMFVPDNVAVALVHGRFPELFVDERGLGCGHADVRVTYFAATSPLCNVALSMHSYLHIITQMWHSGTARHVPHVFLHACLCTGKWSVSPHAYLGVFSLDDFFAKAVSDVPRVLTDAPHSAELCYAKLMRA